MDIWYWDNCSRRWERWRYEPTLSWPYSSESVFLMSWSSQLACTFLFHSKCCQSKCCSTYLSRSILSNISGCNIRFSLWEMDVCYLCLFPPLIALLPSWSVHVCMFGVSIGYRCDKHGDSSLTQPLHISLHYKTTLLYFSNAIFKRNIVSTFENSWISLSLWVNTSTKSNVRLQLQYILCKFPW